MFGTHPFASATGLSRSDTLPPSEMKSLYGSMIKSPVSRRRWNIGVVTGSPYVAFA
jgi:hypothetical protein